MVEALGGEAGVAKKAKKAMKEGKECMRTGMLKWYADYVGGAMKFEQAAKLYKAMGDNESATEAYCLFSQCSEKSNELSGAAEGLIEAAHLTKDVSKSVEYLLMADNFFKIGGASDRGVTEMKKFANNLYEKDTVKSQQLAMEIYEKYLINQCFDEECYVMNSDVPEAYVKMQVAQKDFKGAIRTKKTFMDYLRGEKRLDHQIRRSWLEVVCLQILLEDIYRIEDSLNEFAQDCPMGNPYAQDEYATACDLKDAMLSNNFEQMVSVTKRPIFSYIEIEIVKLLKRFAANPPASSIALLK